MQNQSKTLGESIRRFLNIVKGCGFHFIVPSVRSFDELETQLKRFDSEIEKNVERIKKAVACESYMSRLEAKLTKLEKKLRKRHRKRRSKKITNKSEQDTVLHSTTEQNETVSKVDEPEDTVSIVEEVVETPTPNPLPIPVVEVEKENFGEPLEEVSVQEYDILKKTYDSLIERKKFSKAASLKVRLNKITIKPDVILESDELSIISSSVARRETKFNSEISRVQFVDLYMKGSKNSPVSVPIHLELLDGTRLSPEGVFDHFEKKVKSDKIYALVGDRAYLFSIGETAADPKICNEQREMFILTVEKFLKANRLKQTPTFSNDLKFFIRLILPLWFKFFDEWVEQGKTENLLNDGTPSKVYDLVKKTWK